jgi:hypothetical protein
MQITEVVISAGRTFNHPYEDYSGVGRFEKIQAALALTSGCGFECCARVNS